MSTRMQVIQNNAINSTAQTRAGNWTKYFKFAEAVNFNRDLYVIEGKTFDNQNEALTQLRSIKPNSTANDLGKYKVKDKSFDYAYAHTIHKSQGGTYDYAFVDENNIDMMKNFPNPDYEMLNQLKYVGFSRSSKQTVVLSSQSSNEQYQAKGIKIKEDEHGYEVLNPEHRALLRTVGAMRKDNSNYALHRTDTQANFLELRDKAIALNTTQTKYKAETTKVRIDDSNKLYWVITLTERTQEQQMEQQKVIDIRNAMINVNQEVINERKKHCK